MSVSSLIACAERLGALSPLLHRRDVLLTWELSAGDIAFLHGAASLLEAASRAGLSLRMFETGLGISLFRDKSTRTRYAFRSACNLLGLATEELDESTSQIAHGETVRETAAMIAFLTDVIGIRDDMFLGEGNAYMRAVGEALSESHAAGVLPDRPSVLNLQCDLDHPTQSLADLGHLAAHFGGAEALRGKKLAMSWACSPSYGKPLSVPQGIVALLPRFGMDVVLAHPPGYELEEAPLAAARYFAAENGGRFRVTDSMEEAFEDADVVYPKSWAPARVMHERTHLLRSGEQGRLAELERDALAHNARYSSWTCDETRMARTKGGNALYMHCLPADITGVTCGAGEVSAAVFERARLGTYAEARHKPFVIAAMILATRFADPAGTLARVIERGVRRAVG